MEEKELNLCELLRGCIGKEFYSLHYGSVTLDEIRINNSRGDSNAFLSFHSTNFDSGAIIINPNGKLRAYGEVILYPSHTLYVKYPLDPYSAWMEWKKAREPERWRAKEGEHYWSIDSIGGLESHIDKRRQIDIDRYNCGNYFKDEQTASQAADGIREYLKTFSRK